MRNAVIKTSGYILLRYLLFFIILYTTNKDVKMVGSQNLKNWEDWFMLFWLFVLPLLLELLIIGLPISYGLRKVYTTTNKVPIYTLFVALFIIEFLFANWLYGIQSAFLKVGISVALFLILFWKRGRI